MNLVLVLWLVQLVSTLVMVGVIWFVQLVHYPLFNTVPRSGFNHYHQDHMARVPMVVGLPMVAEAVSAIWLVVQPMPGIAREEAIIGAALLALIWGPTLIVLAPAHKRLDSGFDARSFAAVVRGNWIRTAAWTLRGGVVLLGTARLLRG